MVLNNRLRQRKRAIWRTKLLLKFVLCKALTTVHKKKPLRMHRPPPPCMCCEQQSAGDHDAVICRIGSVAAPDEIQQEAPAISELKPLETQYLREAGII